MKILSIGGGPAALYFAILLKKSHPAHEITIYERNRPGDTFGFGVVFSDATMENLEAADPESFEAIRAAFHHWDDIEIHYRGESLRSTGHGFSGISRAKLLEILMHRAEKLGVRICAGVEVAQPPDASNADLIVAADGANSTVRSWHAEAFRTTIDWRPNRFVWLGTSQAFPAFTFDFVNNEHGTWRLHAYQYERRASQYERGVAAHHSGDSRSTFIVEAHGEGVSRVRASRGRRGRDDCALQEALRGASRRPWTGQESLDLAALPDDPQRALVARPHRAPGRRRAHGALLGGLGNEARDGRRDCAGAGDSRAREAGGCARRVRSGTTRTGPESAARRAGEPGVVREHRAVHEHGADPVRLQSPHAKLAHHARGSARARSRVDRGDRLVVRERGGSAGGSAGAEIRRAGGAAGAHAVSTARSRASEPRGRFRDVPVLLG